MPVLKYRDPNDGLFKAVPVGDAPPEVKIADAEPAAEASVRLWVDPNDTAGDNGWGAMDNTYLRRDGTTAMTGMLTLPATTPSTANHAARKQYVDDQVATRALTTHNHDTVYQKKITVATTAPASPATGDMWCPI